MEFAACQPDDRQVPRRSCARSGRPAGSRTGRRCASSKDSKRFIWESERNGFENFYLYDLSGKLHHPADDAHGASRSPASSRSTRTAALLFYTARDGDNFMKLQLHRVGLDGKGDKRLTDPAFNHTVSSCVARRAGVRRGHACGISPDNKHFVDVSQTHDTPPATRSSTERQGRRRAREERHDEVQGSA